MAVHLMSYERHCPTSVSLQLRVVVCLGMGKSD